MKKRFFGALALLLILSCCESADTIKPASDSPAAFHARLADMKDRELTAPAVMLRQTVSLLLFGTSAGKDRIDAKITGGGVSLPPIFSSSYPAASNNTAAYPQEMFMTVGYPLDMHAIAERAAGAAWAPASSATRTRFLSQLE